MLKKEESESPWRSRFARLLSRPLEMSDNSSDDGKLSASVIAFSS